MPGWNECGIYDEACRNRTCDHPTNPKNQGVQCRTMLSQRPCGSPQCTREDCSRVRPNMCDACGVSQGSREWCEYCGLDTTPPKKPLSEPVSVSEGKEVPDVIKTLTGLSDRDLETLAQALTVLRKASPVGMDYRHVDTLRGHVVDLWLMR